MLGRAIRFGLLAALFYLFGDRVKAFLESHRAAMAAAAVAVVVVTLLCVRWLI